MKKYTVVNAGFGPLPFNVVDPDGLVIATFRDEARANKCASVMARLGKYHD
jgi:hypothetical protein